MHLVRKLIENYVFSDRIPVEGRILNLVCIVGIAADLVAIMARIVEGASLLILGILILILLLIFIQLYCSNHFQSYKIGTWITIILICDIFFPSLLFLTGGLKNGMPAYFVMSTAIILFLSSGKARITMLLTNVALTIACYSIIYNHPQLVLPFTHYQHTVDSVTAYMVTTLFVGFIIIYQRRIFQDERSKVEKAGAAQRRQDVLLHAINESASILLESDPDSFHGALREGMKNMARATGVDQIHIWRNLDTDQGPCFFELCCWMEEGGLRQNDLQKAAAYSYDGIFDGWERVLEEGACLQCILGGGAPEKEGEHQFPPPGLDQILRDHGVVSTLIIPVFQDDRFWGSVSFDDCRGSRRFSSDEESILRSGSMLLINALARDEILKNLVRAQEEALASTKAKSDFLSNMSHEMRTPMNAIIGMTSIALAAGEQEKKDYCLAKIEDASKHLLGVINDILDMSKIEAQKFQLSPIRFQFDKVLHRVLAVINFRVEEKRQQLAIHVREDMPKELMGDDLRLSQIITNLLSNAVKFTPEGGRITLDAWTEPFPAAGDQSGGAAMGELLLWVRVSDTGIGISEDQQQVLFTSFEQAENSTTRKYGGTGLGLAISRNIVEMMGGSIQVESEQGRGSTFTFFVKVGKVAGTAAAAGAGREPPQEEKGTDRPEIPDLQGYTILLAEDMEINKEILEALLEPTGVKMDWAQNGREAVDLYLEGGGKHEMIFMDLQMPEMDGYEATRAIRDLGDSRALTLPIVAMTANVFKEDISRCLAAGMNDHIGKPLNLNEVIGKLEKYLLGA